MPKLMWLAAVGAAGCSAGLAPQTTPDTGAPTAPPPPVDVPVEGAPVVAAYLGGDFATLPAYAGLASVYGAAQIARYLDGTASLTLSATGLAPGVAHTAHVHTWPCEYEGGGHYYLDPATPDAGEVNEIWATLTPDVDGNAAYATTLPTAPRGDAVSVVIHDPTTGDKLACADLAPEQTLGATAEGSIAPFAYAEPQDETIGGNARLTMASSSTLDVTLSGLVATDTYAAHLHVYPCAVTYGGGHYKRDPSVEETLETNELWPVISVNPDGTAVGSISAQSHTVREDGASVVVHRTSAPDAPKVACADLARAGYLGRTTYGTFSPLPTAGAAVVGGSATLDRRLDGVTVLEVELRGLPASAPAPVHLHALPCGVLDGGGHYLVDPAQPEAGEANELWVSVTADTAGNAVGTGYVTHVARAEAQSVVVHAEDGTRLACANLE